MKKYNLPDPFRTLIIIILLTSCTESSVAHVQNKIITKYVCPMHPQIIKNKSGTCPICGMHLVKKTTKNRKLKSTHAYPTVTLTSEIVQILGIRTTKVKKKRLIKQINTVGYVAFNERRLKTIRVGTNGWIENLSVWINGLYVRRGQLLFELYSPEFLYTQKLFIAAQKKDQSGILRKYGQRQESVESRDHLRFMGVPESMMNQIARNGKPNFRLPVYAPINGIIVEYNIHKNKYVYQDEELLTIADLSTVWVEANVYEHQLDWVRMGLNAEIQVNSLPGKEYKGEVNYIYPVLDPKTRTLKVRIRVANTDGRLKPNMFAYVKINSNQNKKILSIPREALIVTGKRESVILYRGNGKFQPVDVVTGIHSNGLVEILSGLKMGDQIVTSGEFLIDSEANLQASFERLTSDQ